jgi:hypothetical protein
MQQIKEFIVTVKGEEATFLSQEIAEKIVEKHNGSLEFKTKRVYESVEDFEQTLVQTSELGAEIMTWAKLFPREREKFNVQKPSKILHGSVMSILHRKPKDPRNNLSFKTRLYDLFNNTQLGKILASEISQRRINTISELLVIINELGGIEKFRKDYQLNHDLVVDLQLMSLELDIELK